MEPSIENVFWEVFLEIKKWIYRDQLSIRQDSRKLWRTVQNSIFLVVNFQQEKFFSFLWQQPHKLSKHKLWI